MDDDYYVDDDYIMDENYSGIGHIDISILYSDNEEEEDSELNQIREQPAQNVDELSVDINLNNDVGATLDEYQHQLKLITDNDKRLKPIKPLDLITSKCSCGNHCEALLSIEEICKYRNLWPAGYHERISSQYFIIGSLVHNGIFTPILKNREVCIKYFSAVNIIPMKRIQRFVELKIMGIDQPVHPNSGRRFEHPKTVERLAKLALFIYYNFEPNPVDNSYMATSQWRRHSAAGEALNIPQDLRRKYNFNYLYKKLTIPLCFKSGNNLVKCTICCESATKLRKRSTPAEEKEQIRKEWDEHKQKNIDTRRVYFFKGELSNTQRTKYLSLVHDGMRKEGTKLPLLNDQRSKTVEDNDRMFCNCNMALIHRKEGNHKQCVGFFSPGSCYGNTSNDITSQILYAISTCDPIPPTVFIQVDNFSGNKSFAFFATFGYFLLRQKAIREFYISFMMPGHTHCDVDARFGNFSQYLQNQQCGSPEELMKAFEESLRGKAVMKQTIYEFKDKLQPLLQDYKGIKKIYDFRIYLDAKGVPMIEDTKFQPAETLLCVNKTNENRLRSKIFKKVPSKTMKFRIIKPKMDSITKIKDVLHKWENVISDTAKVQLENLEDEIKSYQGTPFETLLKNIESKAVTEQMIYEENPLAETSNAEVLPELSTMEDANITAQLQTEETTPSDNSPLRRSTRKKRRLQ